MAEIDVNILVLGGGDSPEREVSLRSAKAIAEAARQAGFAVSQADPIEGLPIFDRLPENTVVLPILHGEGGEDGVLQAILEKHNLPYLGSDTKSSADCFDKWKTREVLIKNKLPVPEAQLVTKDSYEKADLYQKAHVLKVRRGGSSIGTIIARNNKPDSREVSDLFELDKEALIEELIEGIEITVPILDKKALPVVEIIPPEGFEFDYENKYNDMTQEISPPEHVLMDVQDKAKHISEDVHAAMNCRHLSRVDMMIDKQNRLYVLEINTMPGLTGQSLYPKGAAAGGYKMPDLVKKFVELVRRDYHLF